MRGTAEGAELFIDNTWQQQEPDVWKEYQRLMINLPFVPIFFEPGGFQTKDRRALFLTHRKLEGTAELACGNKICLRGK